MASPALLALLTMLVCTHTKICPFTIPLVRLLDEPIKRDTVYT
jgi:hypothetical protein